MQIMISIDVQYLWNVVFSLEKVLRDQNHSSSDSHQFIKKFPAAKFPIFHPGESPIPLNAIWKTVQY